MADSTTAHEVVIVDDFDPVDTPGSYALLTLRPLGKDMIGLRERSLQKDDEIILGRSSRTSQDPSMRPQGDNFRFESPVMSRSHALIKFDGVRLNIVDTDSLHGTFVNGERVIPNTATPLNNGDVLKLGAKVYRNDGEYSYTADVCRSKVHTDPWPSASHEAIEFGFSSHIVGVWADGLVEDSTAADYAYHSEPEDFDESDSTDHHHESSSSAPTTPEKTEARVIHIEDDNKLAGKNGFFGSRTRPIFLEDVEESVAETNTEHPVIVADPHGDIESLKSQVDHSIHCLEKIITGHIESYTTGIAPVGIDQNEARCSDQCEIEDNDDQSECDSCSDGDDHSESSESESWNWSVPEADENETQLPSDAERASDDLALPPSTDSAFPNAKWAEMPFAPSGYNPTKPIFDPVRHAENEQAVICSHFSPTNSISQSSAPDVLTPDQKHSSHGNETIPSHLSFSDELVIRDSFGQVTTDSNTHDPTELGLKTKVSIASLIDERTPQGPLSSSGTGSDWVCAQDANPLLSFTSNHGDEVSTQDEYSQCITADVLSSRKRKAGAFEDGSAWETAEPAPKKLMLAAETVLDPAGSYDLACAARRHQRRAALRQVASKATHVAAGAMLGMVGTIVFLSSSYAEQMIEWLN